jgi:hypothetical protein
MKVGCPPGLGRRHPVMRRAVLTAEGRREDDLRACRFCDSCHGAHEGVGPRFPLGAGVVLSLGRGSFGGDRRGQDLPEGPVRAGRKRRANASALGMREDKGVCGKRSAMATSARGGRWALHAATTSPARECGELRVNTNGQRDAMSRACRLFQGTRCLAEQPEQAEEAGRVEIAASDIRPIPAGGSNRDSRALFRHPPNHPGARP